MLKGEERVVNGAEEFPPPHAGLIFLEVPPMAGAHTLTFTDDNYDAEVKNSADPVLIDFWATWCPPCKMLAPIIDEIADELVGKLKVGKVDTDASPGIRDSFGINSIPTVVLLKSGKEVERIVGFMPKKNLLSKLEPHLS